MKKSFKQTIADLPLVGQVARIISHLYHINRNLEFARVALAEQGRTELLATERYRDPRRLNGSEQQFFSQNGEDGIIAEIFRRVGAPGRFFVEFGVGDGTENNTVTLLMQGWRGVWLEGSAEQVARIRSQFATYIASGQLTLVHTLVTAENIESLFRDAGVPEELDLLSIDIDSRDYWVWQALERYRPRAVVIEYNSQFPPDARWVYDSVPTGGWDQTTYLGASLKSLELLGARKGYDLVGCDITGVNAFFVRRELLGDHFAAPYTAENHYEPPRFHLHRRTGHPRRFGPAAQV
jgi:hypothetical protein